ncbi:hypothetical protein [Gordonia polyisoprenivorans]|uniref:hypothetical protein n=1 Tax=Gordonia polyisoprenivorans TaxID=84595 RepID=UPI001FCAF519|nr:hypothetical protein [Gordonia polyisoprenivorans]
MPFIPASATPKATTDRHCPTLQRHARGRAIINRRIAASPRRSVVTPAAPSAGNAIPMASAAPNCSETHEPKIISTGMTTRITRRR